jgi:hypothetical protein
VPIANPVRVLPPSSIESAPDGTAARGRTGAADCWSGARCCRRAFAFRGEAAVSIGALAGGYFLPGAAWVVLFSDRYMRSAECWADADFLDYWAVSTVKKDGRDFKFEISDLKFESEQ